MNLDGNSAIGKIKRRSRYREAWTLLGVVHDAVTAAGSPFSVSRPLQLDDEHALYVQSALPGQDLATLITATSAEKLLERVGAIHASFHRIPPPRMLPVRTSVDWLAAAAADIQMIALLSPRPFVESERVSAALQRHVPIGERFDFCHGDFVCSQLLLNGQQWSITDFDLCHVGDAYRELAMLIASFAHDLEGSDTSLFTKMADSYLNGYAAESKQRLDERRLRWHRIVAELYHLALALRKGRYSEKTFDQGMRCVLDLADRLADD